MKRAARIGVTGKLGSGKSTLMQQLAANGIHVLNTDQMARDIMVRDPLIRSEIERLAGTEVFTEDGEHGTTLNRQFLAAKLFKDRALRERLEAIVHPAVMREVEREFRDAEPSTPVAVESALILSSDLRQHFDYIVLVDAPDQAVLDRVRQFGYLSEEDASARLAAQDYEHANFDEIDITVENTGNREEFE
ncbi:MAG: dephospho-CoA kinase [Bacteroidota bacterium]|nr:dephospho-CoA kinase [Bacteroidota bacterium]